jgi:hypothetical protein
MYRGMDEGTSHAPLCHAVSVLCVAAARKSKALDLAQSLLQSKASESLSRTGLLTLKSKSANLSEKAELERFGTKDHRRRPDSGNELLTEWLKLRSQRRFSTVPKYLTCRYFLFRSLSPSLRYRSDRFCKTTVSCFIQDLIFCICSAVWSIRMSFCTCGLNIPGALSFSALAIHEIRHIHIVCMHSIFKPPEEINLSFFSSTQPRTIGKEKNQYNCRAESKLFEITGCLNNLERI